MPSETKGKTKRVPSKPSPELMERVRALGLYGILGAYDELKSESWLSRIVELEETARRNRSLERRLRNAKIGRFRPMADFNWKWPKKIDRELVEEVLRLDFFAESANVILIGENGVGKTMIAQNIAYQAVISGKSVKMVTASELLCDLGAKESTQALARAIRRYVNPQVLVIDEIGYLSSTGKHADLLFEIVTRRYQDGRPIVLTTNKTFKEWGEVFPSAGCVATLVDRLVHRAEIIRIEAESYRHFEAQERQKLRGQKRGKDATRETEKKE
jgi:DNA replication protein DnaC